MTDRYAVFGHPVAHSRSPDIHTAFARQTGERLSYERIEAPPDGFAAALDAFFAAGGRGCNVTVPFKAEAFALAARRDPQALRAEAVNTLWRDAGGVLHGANTDGPGLLRDLQANLRWPLAGCAVLVIGAGGASAGILGPLLDAGPGRLRVLNRTPERARALAERWPGQVEWGGLDAPQGRYDLVINASAAGLGGERPPLPDSVLAPGARAYDLVYGVAARPFLEWARAAGAAAVQDGLGMLVEQAAESFHLWRGVRPLTAPVIQALRAG